MTVNGIDFGTHVYIGIAQCGCVRAIVRDMPGSEADTAKEVASFIKTGLKVDRVPNAEGTERFCAVPDCATHNTKPKQESLELA